MLGIGVGSGVISTVGLGVGSGVVEGDEVAEDPEESGDEGVGVGVSVFKGVKVSGVGVGERDGVGVDSGVTDIDGVGAGVSVFKGVKVSGVGDGGGGGVAVFKGCKVSRFNTGVGVMSLSNPFRRAITSQSKSISPVPLMCLAIKPYLDLSVT